MELSIRGRQRRAEQIARPQSQKAQAPAEKRTGIQARREDRLALSKQALAMLEERNRQEREQKAREIEEKKQSANGEIDAATKALKKMLKCQKIAARIMAGDKVPPEDEKYLMDNDPESYKLAIALRKPKEDPKEYDSVLEDEDREGEAEASGDSGASVESCGTSGESAGGGSAPAE